MKQDTAIKYFLESNDPSAFAVKTICDRKYGNEWYDWDPVTVMLELRDDYHANASEQAINRLSAVQVVMTTDEFFQKLGSFMAIVNTFSTGKPSFITFDPVTVPEAAWALEEVGLMRDPVDFNYATKKYLKIILEQDGIFSDPPQLIKDVLFDDTGLMAPSKAEAGTVFLESIHDFNREGPNAYVHDKTVDVVNELTSLGMEDELARIKREAGKNEINNNLTIGGI